MVTLQRGFSFMPPPKPDPEANVDVIEMQYIEKQELEETWKTSRRQRLKEREAKIWEEFVKEQDEDIVSTVCQNDPYQFLENLPESTIRELMEAELQKMKLERESQESLKHAQSQKGDGDNLKEAGHTVTFAEPQPEDEGSEVFQIFDDEGSGTSGPEDELVDDTCPGSPDTVRERGTEHEDSGREGQSAREPGKQENVTTLIENSIYCAKVKELRTKLNEELKSLIITLENKYFINVDLEALNKMKKRSAEFCARFNRIHIYQLTRQIHDIERHSQASLPFAKHTQFQSQMTRITSLHQNLLHALQVFHKAFDATCCLRDSVSVVSALAQAVRGAGAASAAVAAPAASAQIHLYDDEIPTTGVELDAALAEYSKRVEELLSVGAARDSPSSHKSSRCKSRKADAKQKTRATAEARLSMYSDKRVKPTRSTVTAKISSNEAKLSPSNTQEKGKDEKSKEEKAKSRRPLMRDPQGGQPRSRLRQKESDIKTMVQTIEPCASSQPSVFLIPTEKISPSNSPHRASRPPLHTPKNTTPRKLVAPRTLPPLKRSSPRTSPSSKHVKSVPSPVSVTTVTHPELTPVHKIQVQYIPKKDDDGEGEEIEGGGGEKRPESEGQCEVSQLLRRLCGGDSVGQQRSERATGAKNAQLLCVTGSSHRQPSTPELLRILEQTIQKKSPRHHVKSSPRGRHERLSLTFNIPECTAAGLVHYRTKYVQHMLASPMYANGAIGKPWEAISSVSDQIIDDLLLRCTKEMELSDVLQNLVSSEMR